MDELTFNGFLRDGGRAGIRNHTLVLSVNGLVRRAAERVAEAVWGTKLVATPYGRCQVGDDKRAHFRQLTGIGANPNVGAVLVIGADRKSADEVAVGIAELSKQPLEVLTLDDVNEDALELVARGVKICARLAHETSRYVRQPVNLSQLYLGIECGHSDATSGLAANPLAGALADRLIDAGGTAVIGETIEWLGAEQVLSRRATNAAVGSAIVESVHGRERTVAGLGEDLLGNNPGEENVRGGLSTIEEKSLGAIAKAGTRTIHSLLPFANQPVSAGLHLMDGPSFSPESLTGFVASGIQLALLTTGPGNSFGSLIAPTVKISANPESCERLREQIDFDASVVFRARQTLDEAADELLMDVLKIASGALTWNEVVGEGTEVFTRLGASL